MEKKHLTKPQVEELIRAASQSSSPARDQSMLTLAFRLGLRCSEIRLIRVEDLDLGNRTVRVRRLKNGNGAFLTITEADVSLLGLWLEERSTYPKRSDALFLSRLGNSICRRAIWEIVRTAGEKAGLGRVHPHMLRHSAGYYLCNEGHDTRLIQDFLGHRNISSTVIYTQTNPERFRNIW